MKKSMLTLSAVLMSIAAVFAQQTDTTRTQESDQYRRTEGVQSTQPQQTEPSNQMRDTTGLPSDTTNVEGTQPESDTTGVSGTTPVQYDTGTYQTNKRRKSGGLRKDEE
jgi:hypothetical protein